MTKTEMRKLILAIIAPICEEHKYQRLTKYLAFYKICDGVMSFVLFEGKSTGFESGLYVLPLYIPNENLVLDYGNQIWRMDIRNAANYALNCNMSEETIMRHLEKTKCYLQNTGFALLEHFGTPQGVIESISRKTRPFDFFFTNEKKIRPADFFFTGAKKLHVAATFSYFYCGNAKKGLSCYKKLLSILRNPANGSMCATEQQVLEQLIATPSEAETTLKRIQKETMAALHLPEMG